MTARAKEIQKTNRSRKNGPKAGTSNPMWFTRCRSRSSSRSKAQSTTSIFFEIHYTGNGKKAEDQTKVGFVLAKHPPEKQLLNVVAYDTSFEIPPNTAKQPGTTWAILNEPVTLVYLQPHMHLRGTSMDIK